MGTVVVLKEVEKFNQEDSTAIISLQVPAVILDFNHKFKQNLQAKKLTQWAQEGLEVLHVLMLDYERLMQDLALQITPEQLAKVTDLSAQDQIKEDMRRIQDLINTLEAKVRAKKGVTLQSAFEEIKKEESTELGVVAKYLENNDYALFRTMMRVIRWASVNPEEVNKNEQSAVVSCLVEMGAYDTASAVVFLDSRL